MVTNKIGATSKYCRGADAAPRPGTNPFAVPGGPRIAAPAVTDSNLFGYLLLFILVRKINHIFNKVCHNRMKLGCIIGGDDRLARPDFNFLASVSGD